MSQDQISSFVLTSILSVEDFLQFKAMMVKRNVELTNQVIESLIEKKEQEGGLLGGGRNGLTPTGGAVSIKGLVPARKGGVRTEAPAMSEVKGSTKILSTKPPSDGSAAGEQRGSFFDDAGDDGGDDDDGDDDDEPPPAM